MKEKVKVFGVVLLGFLCAQVGVARDLVWEGTNGTWAVGQGGWKLADGTPTVFEEGDNVHFGNAPSEWVTVTLKDHFAVGDMTFDATNGYEMCATYRALDAMSFDGYVTDAQSFEKRGSGPLVFAGFAGTFTNDMVFLEGAFTNKTVFSNKFDIENSGFGNLNGGSFDRVIRFGTGDPQNRVSAYIPYTFFNNGVSSCYAWKNIPATFIFDGADVGYNGQMVFRDVVFLNGSTFACGGSINITGDLHIQRRPDNQPSPRIAIDKRVRWYLGVCVGMTPTNSTTIYVDDVTSADGEPDDQVDFFINAQIENASGTMPAHRGEYRHLVGFSGNSSWAKRGKGTMEMQFIDSYYTGNIDVYEGTLISSHARGLGDNRSGNSVGRRITVHPGAKLTLTQVPTFWLSSHQGWQKPSDAMFVVDNGIVEMKGDDFGCNDWQFYGDAQLKFINNSASFNFASNTVIQCNHPYVFPGWGSVLRLDNLNGYYETEEPAVVAGETSLVTYGNGYSRICVDACGAPTNGIVDLLIEAPLADSKRGEGKVREHPILKQIFGTGNCVTQSVDRCGILKDGTGVMEVTSINNSYTGVTDVREGGLLVTGAVRTNVLVRAGAFVGGAGKIGYFQNRTVRLPNYTYTVWADLVLEEGAGLLVDAAAPEAGLTVTGNVVLPTEGVVKLYHVEKDNVAALENMSLIDLPLPATTEPTDWSHLAGNDSWKVLVDGYTRQETRNLQVTFNTELGTYSIEHKKRGTVMVVR